MEVKLIDASKDNTTLAAVSGRVDTVTAGDFQAAVQDLLRKYPQNIVIDCTELDYLSSAGLRAMFLLVKKAKAVGGTFGLKNINSNIREVISISGFDSFIKIID